MNSWTGTYAEMYSYACDYRCEQLLRMCGDWSTDEMADVEAFTNGEEFIEFCTTSKHACINAAVMWHFAETVRQDVLEVCM